jgi:hypothetical protein
MVVLDGGRIKHAPEGFSHSPFANYLGDLARKERMSFRKKLSPTFVLLDKIRNEDHLWVLAGAKGLGNLMPGE